MSSTSVAQSSARGSLILFIGNLVSTGILTIATIIIARLLGPSGYGVYTLAFVVPSILQLFVGLGVGTAVTRFVAFSISSGDIAKAVSATRTAIVFNLLFGLALSAFNFEAAPFFVTTLMHRPDLVQYVQDASLFVVGLSIAQCSTYALIGWGSMGQVSALAVVQAVLKLGLGAGLIVAGFGVVGAIIGHLVSYVVQGALGCVALYLFRIRKTIPRTDQFAKDLVAMTRFGFPLFAGSFANGVSGQYCIAVLASVVANSVIGYYQVAINVVAPIGVISGAVSNVLFRSFAELHGMQEDISLAFAYSVRYVSLVLTPIVFFLLAAAAPLFNLFYGPAYSPGIELLRLVAISYFPVAIGMTVLPSFLNGVGRSSFTMYISIAASVALVVTTLVLVLSLGLGAEGLVLAIFASNLALTILGWILSMKYLNVRLVAKPLVGIFLSGLVGLLLVTFLPSLVFSSAGRVLIDACVFTLAYLIAVPLLSGVDYDDLVRLSISFETMGPLRKPLEAILSFERRILKLRGA